MNIFKDIQDAFELFFDDLNWTYIFTYLIALYGIKNVEEFYWYNLIFDKTRLLRTLKSWIAGLIVGGLFCFFTEELNKEYIGQLLRSYLVTITFNTAYTNRKLENIIKKDEEDS